jgi:hypothetical protein
MGKPPWKLLGLVAAGIAGAAAVIFAIRRSAYRKVADDDVDSDGRSEAERMGNAILTAWKEDRFDALGDDASDTLRAKLDADKQRQAHDAMKDAFGEYESLEYVETWKPKNGASLRIYRFRGTFSGAARPEVRVVLDGQKRLSGFWVKAWATDVR